MLGADSVLAAEIPVELQECAGILERSDADIQPKRICAIFFGLWLQLDRL